jgi:hypothetical protein
MLLHAADTLKQRISLALSSLAPCTALTLSALYQRADLALSALMTSGAVDQCVDQHIATSTLDIYKLANFAYYTVRTRPQSLLSVCNSEFVLREQFTHMDISHPLKCGARIVPS